MKTTSQKLEQLADFLEKLPDERFDYTLWGYVAPSHWLYAKPALASCGTVGCAAGWLDAASGGECRAWSRRKAGWEFDISAAEAYLGLDTRRKRRPGESYRSTDFERLFNDRDCKLRGHGVWLNVISKSAAIARIRACAADYAKRGK